MHLYLREAPRTIYLVTSSQEEAAGRPPRVLVVRTAENDPSRAVVELLHKDDVELSAVVRLTGRVVGNQQLAAQSQNRKVRASSSMRYKRTVDDMFVLWTGRHAPRWAECSRRRRAEPGGTWTDAVLGLSQVKTSKEQVAYTTTAHLNGNMLHLYFVNIKLHYTAQPIELYV